MKGEDKKERNRERHSVPGLIADLRCKLIMPVDNEGLAAAPGRIWDFSASGVCILLRGYHSIATNENFTIEIIDTLSHEKETFKGQSAWSRRNTANTYIGFKFQNHINLEESIFKSFIPKNPWLTVNAGFPQAPSGRFFNLNEADPEP